MEDSEKSDLDEDLELGNGGQENVNILEDIVFKLNFYQIN